jgi:hypothetical protein
VAALKDRDRSESRDGSIQIELIRFVARPISEIVIEIEATSELKRGDRAHEGVIVTTELNAKKVSENIGSGTGSKRRA